MATIIDETMEQKPAAAPYSLVTIALVGAILGLLYWCLTIIIGNYVMGPVFCGVDTSATNCLKTPEMSGDIATVLIATIGIIIMVSLRMIRPLVIAVASAAVLWGLSSWTSGMEWIETIFWTMLLYIVSYVLFSWIARYPLIKTVLFTMLGIVIIARIAVLL